MADTQPAVPFFKKGKSRPANNRRRSPSPPSSASPARAALAASSASGSSSQKSEVILPSRKQAANLLSAGTKRTAAQREALDADEQNGPDVKWTAAGSHQHAAQEILDGDEAEEIMERRARKARIDAGEDDEDEGRVNDGMYHGQAGYKAHLVKSKDVPKAMRVGPQRNTSTIRTVTIVDYQPDVCKDYKETGYCGFGDTCKFLHDRGTYLAGWQLDKLAADPKKQAADGSDSDSDDEDIPFACLICRHPYTDPVVTRCGHYFCSACAIRRFAKTPKCLACGAPTGGIFNRADKVIDKMRKKKAEDEAEAAGEVEGGGGGDLQLEGLGEASDED